MRRLLFQLVITVVLAGSAYAETILLKDGNRLKGTIVGESADSVRLLTPEGVMPIRRERIQSIDYGSEAQAPPRETTPTQTLQVPPSSHVESEGSSFQLTLEPGYRFATDESEPGFSGDLVAMSKVSAGAFVGVSGGFEYFRNKVESLPQGTVVVIPLMVRTILRASSGLSFGAGLGYAFADHNLDDELRDALASVGVGLEENIKPGFVGEVAVGFTTKPESETSVGLFAGYQMHKPKVEANITDLSTGNYATGDGDVDLSAPFVRAFLSF